MNQSLSPAANAAWEAFNKPLEQGGWIPDYGDALAAFTRALADQVVPQELEPPEQPISDCNDPWNGWNAKQTIRRQIFDIAAELEGK